MLKLTTEHLLSTGELFHDRASRVEDEEGAEDGVDNRRGITRTVHELGDLLREEVETEGKERELEEELQHFILLS